MSAVLLEGEGSLDNITPNERRLFIILHATLKLYSESTGARGLADNNWRDFM